MCYVIGRYPLDDLMIRESYEFDDKKYYKIC